MKALKILAVKLLALLFVLAAYSYESDKDFRETEREVKTWQAKKAEAEKALKEARYTALAQRGEYMTTFKGSK